MGFRLEFDTNNKILLLSVEGVLTDRTLLDGYAAFKNCWEPYGTCHCIIDYTPVTEVKLTPIGIKFLADKPPILPRNCVTVNVAPQNVMYAMARMFQVLSRDSRPNFRVVHTMEEALRYFAVDSPTFASISDDLQEAA